MLSLAATADENGVVQGKDGWLFLKEELEHLGSKAFYGKAVIESSKATKPEFADPLPAIVDFSQQLKVRGIQLVFAPIPPKALIYSGKLPGEISPGMLSTLDKMYTDLYTELSKQGVQVLDLIPLFLTANNKEQLYCKTDTHYSGAGLSLVASEFSKEIKKNDWYAGVRKKTYAKTKQEISIHGDLAAMEKSDSKETLSLDFVTDSVKDKAEVPDPDSPVLLLGDSHTLVFSVGGDLHSHGAGLFDQLSADIKFPVDLLGVRGSGATPSRIKLYQRARKDKLFLEKKKIVIWCLSARELTGSGGWKKIPIAKKK
jgi:alginate O-acetyltransferase complex protein AlgJ